MNSTKSWAANLGWFFLMSSGSMSKSFIGNLLRSNGVLLSELASCLVASVCWSQEHMEHEVYGLQLQSLATTSTILLATSLASLSFQKLEQYQP